MLFFVFRPLRPFKTKLKIVQDSLEGEQEFVIHSEPEDGSVPKQGSQEQAPKQGWDLRGFQEQVSKTFQAGS